VTLSLHADPLLPLATCLADASVALCNGHSFV
jgi:hypothetical protein